MHFDTCSNLFIKAQERFWHCMRSYHQNASELWLADNFLRVAQQNIISDLHFRVILYLRYVPSNLSTVSIMLGDSIDYLKQWSRTEGNTHLCISVLWYIYYIYVILLYMCISVYIMTYINLCTLWQESTLRIQDADWTLSKNWWGAFQPCGKLIIG